MFLIERPWKSGVVLNSIDFYNDKITYLNIRQLIFFMKRTITVIFLCIVESLFIPFYVFSIFSWASSFSLIVFDSFT